MKKKILHAENEVQSLSPSEMKEQTATSSQATKDWWSDLWNGDLKDQAKACEGKSQGDRCTFSGTSVSGVCAYDSVTGKLYCAEMAGSGVGSGTGALSPREEACLNKKRGDCCRFYGNSGTILDGKCAINNNHMAARPLFCSQSIGAKEGESTTESESTESQV